VPANTGSHTQHTTRTSANKLACSCARFSSARRACNARKPCDQDPSNVTRKQWQHPHRHTPKSSWQTMRALNPIALAFKPVASKRRLLMPISAQVVRARTHSAQIRKQTVSVYQRGMMIQRTRITIIAFFSNGIDTYLYVSLRILHQYILWSPYRERVRWKNSFNDP
jgi:hypothetical protein